jgi:hypothetical protein
MGAVHGRRCALPDHLSRCPGAAHDDRHGRATDGDAEAGERGRASDGDAEADGHDRASDIDSHADTDSHADIPAHADTDSHADVDANADTHANADTWTANKRTPDKGTADSDTPFEPAGVSKHRTRFCVSFIIASLLAGGRDGTAEVGKVDRGASS